MLTAPTKPQTSVASTPFTDGHVIPVPFPASRLPQRVLRFAGPEELPKIVQHRAHAVETPTGREVAVGPDEADAAGHWAEGATATIGVSGSEYRGPTTRHRHHPSNLANLAH